MPQGPGGKQGVSLLGGSFNTLPIAFRELDPSVRSEDVDNWSVCACVWIGESLWKLDGLINSH